MKDIMKIVKSLEELGWLIKDISEIIKSIGGHWIAVFAKNGLA